MLAYSKNRKLAIFSLIFIMLSNLFFVSSFCCLFVSELFYKDYYLWLKIIDLVCCLVVLVNMFFCVCLLSKYHSIKKMKEVKTYSKVFDCVQIALLLVVLLNLISFYEGPVFILLLVGLGFFVVGEFILLSLSSAEECILLSFEKQKPELIRTFDANLKSRELKEIKLINNTTVIINKKFTAGFCVSLVAYVFVLIAFILFSNYELITQKITNTCFVAIPVSLLVVLCCFGIKELGRTSLARLSASRWIMLAVVLVNTLIFATTVFLAFFNGADSITIYCAVVLMFLTQIANQFLFADHNRLKYIKSFANLQQIKKNKQFN